MSSQNGAYDQNLLDEAPVATRAQRQEGYNVDLLDDRPTRPASTQPLKPQTLPSDTDVESSSVTQEKIIPGNASYTSRPAQSFWRTRNGKITIFIVAIVVLGAVVGGAVGGTVGKIGSNNNIPSSTVVSGESSTATSGETSNISSSTSTSAFISTSPPSDPSSQAIATASTTTPGLGPGP